MKRSVVVGGAGIKNYARIKAEIREDDYIICCDSGLKHVSGLGVKPSLIVGDFDSHENPRLDIETIVLPCEKDDTDTVYAVKEAIKRGFTEFLLVGVIGERLDHTLGNLYILDHLDGLGLKGSIIDDYSVCSIVSKEPEYIDASYEYFSLLNITGSAKGITVENAKYPLDNGEIPCSYQYGVSNEVLPGKTAKVTVKEGKLLLIKVFPQAAQTD